MKKVYFVSALLSLLSVPCFSQQFSYLSDSPFGIKPIRDDATRNAQRIFFFDADQDGDLDVFLSGIDHIDTVNDLGWNNIHYFLEMQENTGDKWNPQFGPRMSLFENFPFPQGYYFPSLGDINGDGFPDFMVSAEVDYIGNRTLTYCKNSGQSISGPFEVTRADSMGLPNFLPESMYFPELVDLDHDGDLDLLASGFNPAFADENGDDVPNFYYAKNTGTPTAPIFLGWYSNPYGLLPNPFGLPANTFFEATTCGDIDNDGDVDILGTPSAIPADSMNYLYFHEDTPGPDGKPSFSTVTKSPFGLPVSFGDQQFFFPILVDLDGDGDLDLFVFRGTPQSSVLSYYVNNFCTTTTHSISQAICEGESLVIGGEAYDTPGDYTIHLSGSKGCDSIILLSLSLLQPSMVSLSETICQGENYQVGNETFTTTGNYMVVLIATNGCDSIISLDLSVTDVDNSVTAIDNAITANLAGASYQWLDCDSGQNIPGETNQTFTPSATGSYAVNITDGSGCSAISACTLVMISGTKEVELSKKISIYPNPATQWIKILNLNPEPVTQIKLINLSGQVIKEIKPNGCDNLDLSFLEQGIYMLKMDINGLEIIKKLVILK